MMNDEVEDVSGAERAAIFMMSLGEHKAAEVLKHMDPKEVQKIGTIMATLDDVSSEKVEMVVGAFVDIANGQSGVGNDPDDYIRTMITKALGEKKAGSVIDRILLGRDAKGLDSLKWMDPVAVSAVIKNEHPQIIAIVLSYLDGDHAAEVLQFLPASARSDVLMRVATLDGVTPEALDELNQILEKQFSTSTGEKSSGVGGVKAAAEILNYLDTDAEATITEEITEQDAALAEEIQSQMFVFNNLLDIDDRGIQTLLRDVQSEQLVIALKGADEPIKEKIFNNMSSRAADMMREDLEAKGPVKLKEVEDAQMEMLEVAKRLAEAGDITIGGKGDDEYV